MNPTLFRSAFQILERKLTTVSMETLLTGKRPSIYRDGIVFTLHYNIAQMVHTLFVNGHQHLNEVDFQQTALGVYLDNLKIVGPEKYPFPISIPAETDWCVVTDLSESADPFELRRVIKEALLGYVEIFRKVDTFYANLGVPD